MFVRQEPTTKTTTTAIGDDNPNTDKSSKCALSNNKMLTTPFALKDRVKHVRQHHVSPTNFHSSAATQSYGAALFNTVPAFGVRTCKEEVQTWAQPWCQLTSTWAAQHSRIKVHRHGNKSRTSENRQRKKKWRSRLKKWLAGNNESHGHGSRTDRSKAPPYLNYGGTCLRVVHVG